MGGKCAASRHEYSVGRETPAKRDISVKLRRARFMATDKSVPVISVIELIQGTHHGSGQGIPRDGGRRHDLSASGGNRLRGSLSTKRCRHHVGLRSGGLGRTETGRRRCGTEGRGRSRSLCSLLRL